MKTLQDFFNHSGAYLETIVSSINEWETDYMMKGATIPGTDGFALDTISGDRITLMAIPDDDIGGSLISERAALAIQISGQTTPLTWGEAAELIVALKALVSVQMFG
jgi:hypothetical protein